MKEKNSAWKGLLKTMFATTLSIVLTFGTAALIERHKQAKEKRQIVLMLMYDFDNSLNQARHCDSVLQRFVELQTRIIEDPAIFDDSLVMLLNYLPSMKYTETIENIFSSNIETIHTISNVYFIEKISESYQLRERFYKNIEEFESSFDKFILSPYYEDLVAFPACNNFVVSSYVLADMEYLYKQCKQIMKVTDKEMDAFYQVRQKIEATAGEKENVWKTKIPNVRDPWREAIGKSQRKN